MRRSKNNAEGTGRPAKRTRTIKGGDWLVDVDKVSSEGFRIDKIIRALENGTSPGLLPYWRENSREVFNFAHRGLEIATAQAADARHNASRKPIVEEYESVAEAAGKAESAIRSLMQRLTNGPPDSPHLMLYALRVLRTIDTASTTEADVRARATAEILWKSYEATASIAKVAQQKADRLKINQQNPGNPDDRRFALVIGELWVKLTGQRPSANPSGSLFQDFLATAWLDAGRTLSKDADDQMLSSFLRMAQEARHAYGPDVVKTVAQASDEPIPWREWGD